MAASSTLFVLPQRLAAAPEFFKQVAQAPPYVVTWNAPGQPVPVVVQCSALLEVPLNQNILDVQLNAQYLTDPSGVAFDGTCIGFLKIEYGVGAVLRTIYVDLKSQAIQLPASTYVKVSMARFNGANAPANLFAMQVGISIAEGTVSGDTPLPTCTMDLGKYSNGDSVDYYIPPAAKYVSIVTEDLAPFDLQVEMNAGYIDFSVPSQWPAHAAWQPWDNLSRQGFFQAASGAATNVWFKLVWEIAP